MNNKKLLGSICLDISKAFNCIDHEKLYNKMISCGISDSIPANSTRVLHQLKNA